jgi:ferritin-like metal-binding protein YciE
MKTKEELIEWLQDAYAMESAMLLALKKQIDSEKVSQRMREQASIHYVETEGHAKAVQDCLKKLGTDTSLPKRILAEGLEALKGTATMFAKDERIKDAIAAYASEHFEIACYTALRTGALKLGMPQVVGMCNAIILEEEKMAGWLQKHLPAVVGDYLYEKP